MKKTFKELQEIDQLIGYLYQVDPKLKDTKFGYAFNKLSNHVLVPAINKFRERIEIIRVNNALEDSNKAILLDKENPRGFKYSKEGLTKCMEEEIKLTEAYDKEEFEFEPYISSFTPEQLTEDQKELLTGILI